MSRIIMQWVFALVVLASPMAVHAKNNLDQCRKLYAKIEHYDELRRQGGSGAQMDAWKRSRRSLEKQFRSLGCRYYRGRLD